MTSISSVLTETLDLGLPPISNFLIKLRSRVVQYKALAYRFWFQCVGNRRASPIINGRVLQTLREAVLPLLEYQESVCNAGMLSTKDGWICVAKNQRFSLAHELKRRAPWSRQPPQIMDDSKLLYGLRFDSHWKLQSCKRLNVLVDGRKTMPSDGVEDVRLFIFGNGIWAYATGSGNRRSAWPLIGSLSEEGLELRSVVAPYNPPQKNWMPFVLDGIIFLEYSIRPHTVLQFDPKSSRCEFSGTSSVEHPGFEDLELHGGAPAIRLNDEFFLGVGNSQRRFWYQERYYAPVFYIFEAAPPFAIVRMSQPVRLLSRRERVQYVCGMILSPDRQTLTISYGIADHENCFVAIPLSDVLKLAGANDLFDKAY